ncbi:non-hydrolyzing UDP-N-acetylglucosamine 2-epimerase [Roseivirga misakiensis]|uniref:UDP-N-acetylglucosamine 2-epimerase n=1 Tax=Roseivirga misakiensis TaxID=1563681 RepID=A0A1E5T3K3_9BACT|nr:UDP-N-acetylglucosamine 2-epimerase (non-hydrolyzing) [Roseivirga misakiensis]OEK05965.1 UDP-N-acetylglucosamine 2-epimerase [Roseivirga misakiensis]
MKVLSVVGARPNFMKVAPFIHEIQRHNEANEKLVDHILVHTGQHYDPLMSDIFFERLGIPRPDHNLNIGSGGHGVQLGQTMIAFDELLQEVKPDWVVVIGDVNATLSCSVIAKRHQIKVCHIESGLRSFDKRMPEEINRMVTDSISDLLLTPDTISSDNLRREGKPEESIKFVGNIMIDTLVKNVEQAKLLNTQEIIEANRFKNLSVVQSAIEENNFGLMTMHRPSNVDDRNVLLSIVETLENKICPKLSIVLPLHPRTEKQLKTFGLWERFTQISGLVLLNPIGYLELLKLNTEAKLFLSDSGGIQEECTYLGTPCITLRDSTERPVTLKEHGGVSVLVGNNMELVEKYFNDFLTKDRQPQKPALWDGNTAKRCLEAILSFQD